MPQENSQQYDRQRLFEKWVKKPDWSIDEAAALLIARDPEAEGESSEQEKIARLIKENVSSGNLEPNVRGENMYLDPLMVYQWARRQEIDLPVELEALMEFVMKMTLPSSTGDIDPTDDITPADDIERLLGACVSILMNYPQECLGKKGKISIEKLLKKLDQNADQLFGGRYPSLSGVAIRDIVNSWQAKL